MTTSLTTMANASDQSLAGLSNTPSESASESKSFLAEPVRKCIKVLEQAETDTEKFAALFLVPKLMRGVESCDKKARMHLIEAIGYSFLGTNHKSQKYSTYNTQSNLWIASLHVKLDATPADDGQTDRRKHHFIYIDDSA